MSTQVEVDGAAVLATLRADEVAALEALLWIIESTAGVPRARAPLHAHPTRRGTEASNRVLSPRGSGRSVVSPSA